MLQSFTKEDFDALKKVASINSRSFDEKNGYNSKQREKAKEVQKPVWNKLKDLKEDLDYQKYYNIRFDSHICNPHKQSTETTHGHIRPNLWLSLVDLHSVQQSKKKHNIHQSLPQIQISIHQNRLVTASVYLQGNGVSQKDREKFIDFVTNNGIKKPYQLMVWHRKNKKQITNPKIKDLPKYNHRAYNLAIEIAYSKNNALSKNFNLQSLIKRDVQKIYEEIFAPCFGYESSKEKEPKSTNTRYRKGTTDDLNIKSSLRKGTVPTTVNRIHNEIQNELKEHLENKFKHKNGLVYLEGGFVDLKLQFENDDRSILYEIKTDKDAINCIKHGLGQLLFYNLTLIQREQNWKSIELVIVGLASQTSESEEFVRSIQKHIGPNKFRYQKFDRKKKVLVSENRS